MPRDINRRTMVTEGTESSHQHTKGSAFSHSSEDTSPDGQQNIFNLSGKDGAGGLTTRTFLVFLNKYGIICSRKRSQLLQCTYQVM